MLQILYRRPMAKRLLSLACALLVALAGQPALAQSPGTTFTPSQIMDVAKASPAQAAGNLATAAGISTPQATQVINNLGNISNPTALLNGLINKQISGAIGAAMSGIPNLGNLNAQQIATAFAQNGIKNLLSGALGGSSTPSIGTAQQALNQAMAAMQIAGDASVQGILATGATAAVTALLQQVAPELAAVLGPILGVMLGGTTVPDPQAQGVDCQYDKNIPNHHKTIKSHMTNKKNEHEMWMVTEFFTKHVAPALMLMAEQLTVVGMQQVQIIGSFFDAKHQLETQRLMQQLTAVAHKDYQPSEGLCTFGTSVRSLASSERTADMAQITIATRGMARQLNQGDSLSGGEGGSKVLPGPLRALDRSSRLNQFITTFCNTKDNNETLDELCKDTKASAEQKNRDIDYTQSVENKLTLDLDFYTSSNDNPSDDEENIFALAANLYAHDTLPYVDHKRLGKPGKNNPFDAEKQLMDVRALAAKRSVAQNSFAAITAMKAPGTPEAQPYLYKMVEELGVPEKDLQALLGKNPSYFAQMEILTKKALQNPVFYTELYDKPVNVERKAATLQAIGLMQDRDIYKSLIRSEAILSVLLESMLIPDYERAATAIGALNRTPSTQMRVKDQ